MLLNTRVMALLGLAFSGTSTARVIDAAHANAFDTPQDLDDCPLTLCVDYIDDCGQTYGGCGDICTGGPTFTTPFCDQTTAITTTPSTPTPSTPSPSPTPSITTPSISTITISTESQAT